jgi:hypothetical protein
MDMLGVYRYLGKNDFYEERLSSNYEEIVEQTIERDTFFLAVLTNLDVSDTRMRLIITKNSKPRNKEETTLSNFKEIIRVIHKNYDKVMFNSSDLLSMANKIYDKNSIKFSNEKATRKTPLVSQALRSKRVTFDEMLTEYTLDFEKEKYERVFLALLFFIDCYNFEPFSDKNDVISYLALYYLLLRSHVDAFKYVSFFEAIFGIREEFEKEIKTASFNWNEGFPQILGLVRLMFKIIRQSYNKLDSIIKDYYYEEKFNKADNVENTIYKLPEIFTKDDIKVIHPYISESTINRTLARLRDQNLIRPLGKGRSAKWHKIIQENDFERIFRG